MGKGKAVSIKAGKVLLKCLTRNCKGRVVQQTMPFSNQEVPAYLRMLHKSEKDAAQSRILVK